MVLSQNSSSLWGRKIPAPAKLNLMLRIVGRRNDGYHLLQTVFQFIDLCDWITFYPSDDGLVRLKNPIPGVPEVDDLTVRAANLLKAETCYKNGVVIEIEKNIPMGGGLGGGSSDAATVLVSLNKLWELGLSLNRLMELGLTLGADVPIFVSGHSAWAEGVGERLQGLVLPERWVVVLKPECHVSTKEIFDAKELTRDQESIRIDDFLAGQDGNAFSEVVCARYEAIKDAMSDLDRYSTSRLTGTGACVFAEFSSYEQAADCAQELKNKWNVYLVRSVNESPLFEFLKVSLQ